MADDTVRVDPLTLQGAAASLSGAAEHLQAQLAELDDQVGRALGGWRGVSGDAYGAAWESWHRGAGEVRAGLSILAHAIAQAASVYQGNEAGAARAMREVRGG